jgi:hypothetical protein
VRAGVFVAACFAGAITSIAWAGAQDCDMREGGMQLVYWLVCAETAAERFAAQPEQAAVIADAALMRCISQERAYDIAIGGPGCVEETDYRKNEMRGVLISYIISFRATTPGK